MGKNLCAAFKNNRDGKDRRFPELKIEEIFEYDIDMESRGQELSYTLLHHNLSCLEAQGRKVDMASIM